ncbi:unnamed protein product [Polarella glacialis]|uniref:Uncharacterized protein n=1 Tax=Polarella glacialis TaxID=89957 RepID=A0A813EIC9_POLGL|nr:unnamed protein product [Polarella glacialis]
MAEPDLTMPFEVTVQLRPQAGLGGVSQEEIFRAVQDEYVSRYLDHLGIASTPANKAAVMKFKPLDDCEVHGIWAEDSTAGVADAIKIAPPLRQRFPAAWEGDDFGPVDKVLVSHLYGVSTQIPVQPPPWPLPRLNQAEPAKGAKAVSKFSSCVDEDKMVAGEWKAKVGHGASELAEELERTRLALSGPGRPPGGGHPGGNRGHAANALGGGAAAGATGLDSDRRERFCQELELLKSKFILPFACERPVKEGSQRTMLCPWPAKGPLDIELPSSKAEVMLEALTIEMEQIRRNTQSWVQDQLPLELLSTRGRHEPRLLEKLRLSLCGPEMIQLTGLLSHLLYWLAFSCCRGSGLPRLAPSALQGLVSAAHELWVSLERKQRDTQLGVCLAMPCVLLTLKRGMERCFESQYPGLFGASSGDWAHRQALVDRINTLLMRLFDPDCIYAKFGRLDAGLDAPKKPNNAIALTRQLDLLAAAEGNSKTKRLHGRSNRATPLVRAALQAGLTGGGGAGTNNPKTRNLLERSDLGGAAPLASVVVAPEEHRWRSCLLQAAIDRLQPTSPRPPSPPEAQDMLLTGRGARGYAESARGGVAVGRLHRLSSSSPGRQASKARAAELELELEPSFLDAAKSRRGAAKLQEFAPGAPMTAR